MQEKLEQLRKSALLEIYNRWGLGEPGYNGTIITKDKKIYNYYSYIRPNKILIDNGLPLEQLSKGRLLTNEKYNKIIHFIEREIKNKQFDSLMIRDVTYIVRCNYNSKIYNLPNCIDTLTKEELYPKVKKIIDEIEGVKYEKKQ